MLSGQHDWFPEVDELCGVGPAPSTHRRVGQLYSRTRASWYGLGHRRERPLVAPSTRPGVAPRCLPLSGSGRTIGSCYSVTAFEGDGLPFPTPHGRPRPPPRRGRIARVDQRPRARGRPLVARAPDRTSPAGRTVATGHSPDVRSGPAVRTMGPSADRDARAARPLRGGGRPRRRTASAGAGLLHAHPDDPEAFLPVLPRHARRRGLRFDRGLPELRTAHDRANPRPDRLAHRPSDGAGVGARPGHDAHRRPALPGAVRGVRHVAPDPLPSVPNPVASQGGERGPRAPPAAKPFGSRPRPLPARPPLRRRRSPRKTPRPRRLGRGRTRLRPGAPPSPSAPPPRPRRSRRHRLPSRALRPTRPPPRRWPRCPLHVHGNPPWRARSELGSISPAPTFPRPRLARRGDSICRRSTGTRGPAHRVACRLASRRSASPKRSPDRPGPPVPH